MFVELGGLSVKSPPPDRPLREEILTREGLIEHAAILAAQHKIYESKRGWSRLYKRFEENHSILENAYFLLAAGVKENEPITPGGEWLLDNYHIIEETARDIKHHLPKGYYRTLPKLSEGKYAGYPRVYSIAFEVVAHTDSIIDSDIAADFIESYQKEAYLRIGELWAVPIMLRLALMENLRRLALTAISVREQQRIVESITDEIVGEDTASSTDISLALATRVKDWGDVLPSGAAHMIRQLRGMGSRGSLALNWFEKWLEEQGLNSEEITRQEQYLQAANQISIGNAVTSMKTIASIDWKEWVQRLCMVDRILSGDPVYPRCSFATRDAYRRRIEHLARKTGSTETDVARRVARMAEEARHKAEAAGDSSAAACAAGHVGCYLIGEYKGKIETEIGYQHSFAEKAGGIYGTIRAFYLYFWAMALMLAFLLLGGGLLLWSESGSLTAVIVCGVFLLVPLWDLAINLVNWCVTHLVPPSILPKMDFDDEVPDECKTLVVVHTILQDKGQIRNCLDDLEVRFLANNEPNVFFSILADLSDADTESLGQDESLIEYALSGIRTLNTKYFGSAGESGEGRFLILIRKRVWHDSESKFHGWERKRGKITELNRLIMGENTDHTFKWMEGNIEALTGFKYVITLDSDTYLPRQSAARLIAAMAHPLNRPVFDEEKRVVVKGYGIIQPRVGTSLVSSHATRFAEIFSGDAGLDPYTSAVSDVYQDLFFEGSYIGKGIYDVEAFEKALSGRVPEQKLLSHDLFEGLFARVALASDIELVDDFPSSYPAFVKRQHRWVRGDWQILPWLFRRVPGDNIPDYESPISPLGKWKIFDNLRRSLVAPSGFMFLLSTWLFVPSAAVVSALILFAVFAFPVFADLANVLFISPFGFSLSGYIKGLVRDLLKGFSQALLLFCFLPHKAYVMLHAVVLALYRMYISRRDLLDWETAFQSEKRLGVDLLSCIKRMKSGVLLAAAAEGLVVALSPEAIACTGAVVILWILSPVAASFVSRPRRRSRYILSKDERDWLIGIARNTWEFFDELATAENNYLVPDNIQLVPKRVVVNRTSSTNISLNLLAIISAYDFGFIGIESVVQRLKRSLEAIQKLDRYRGHLYNWYDIKTLRPLKPLYISLVDSGNFAGHLIAVKSALEMLLLDPLVSESRIRSLRALFDEAVEQSRKLDPDYCQKVECVKEALELKPSDINSLAALITELEGCMLEMEQPKERSLVLSGALGEKHLKLSTELKQILSIKELLSWHEEFFKLTALINRSQAEDENEITNRLNRSMDEITRALSNRTPSIQLVLAVCSELLEIIPLLRESAEDLRGQADDGELEGQKSAIGDLIEALSSAVESSLTAAGRLGQNVSALITACENLIIETDFSFLYSKKKKVFAIGFNVDEARQDVSYYDLLASESRLASLVAIAKGDVPQEHWFMMGRRITNTPGGKALLSWSGTMFEYLMPLLVNRDYPGTLLSETYAAVVKAQRLYARRLGIPWGISESGYAGVDFENTYQYRAFGVPSLGLKRGLSKDLVVSPYSSFLAMLIDPKAAIKNIKKLEKTGARNRYGFYEAIDYTPERLRSDEEYHIVQSFLAHHQGMILASLNNIINGCVLQERFHRDTLARSCDRLLQEKFPLLATLLKPHQAELSYIEREEEDLKASAGEVFYTWNTPVPRTRVLSNGSYSLMINNSGSGYSYFDGNFSVTRWREDGVCDDYGSYVFVRDLDKGRIWSVSYQPSRAEPDFYEVIFNPDKVEFKRKDAGIGLHTEITVSPEDNIEIRRITVTNFSGKPRNLEFTSFGEVVLGHREADLAHPAFHKMFIESEYLDDFDALLFTRRPRSRHEPKLYLLHMLSMPVVWERIQFETSRENFIGRGRDVHAPKVFASDYTAGLSGTVGPVLDPAFSLRARIEIKPGEKQSLTFVTAVAKDREEILFLAQFYRYSHAISRAFEMAWSKSNVELRHNQISIAQTHSFHRLANAIFYQIREFRGREDVLRQNRLGQSGLWRFGISGDLPIVLVKVRDPSHAKIVNELVLAHRYLRERAVFFDLVVLNEYSEGYWQDFQEQLKHIIDLTPYSEDGDRSGSIYLRTGAQISHEEKILLSTVARVVLAGDKGTLNEQLSLPSSAEVPTFVGLKGLIDYLTREETRSVSYELDCKPQNLPAVELYNGIGGFSKSGKSYTMLISSDNYTPLPWINVIANEKFGTVITERGSGYTWSDNSRENKLSPWSNDPVSDPAGEAVYIRDANTGKFWSPTPSPVASQAVYRVEHGFGYSEFETEIEDVKSKLLISCGSRDKIKFWKLEVSNQSSSPRRLELYFYVDWVLGVSRDKSAQYIVTDFDTRAELLTAINHYNNEFAGRVAFIGSNLKVNSFSARRDEFVGRHGDLSKPCILNEAVSVYRKSQVDTPGHSKLVDLSKTVGAGFDPCGVIQVVVNLDPGSSKSTLFYLGEAGSLDDARTLSRHFRVPSVWEEDNRAARDFWDRSLSSVEVKTPERSFDLLMNGWLVYQAIASRIFGRTAFYQCGGAIGFRDQLQDVLALMYTDPAIAKDQILLAASRQFTEGDVQHWWHPPTGRGVRTIISDDYLWLPYVVNRYIEVTGDQSILEEEVAFLDAPLLEPGQMEAYLMPHVSNQRESIYHHCVLALNYGLKFGPHGLPLIRGGDWNDGMNEVGREGKGESVWLGWFLYHNLKSFEKIASERRDNYRSKRYGETAEKILEAIEEYAWDDHWYLRAFFDDGTPLGSSANPECMIDSLSQSWSVITGAGYPLRQRAAMEAVYEKLVDDENRLIRLLTPPFDSSELEPGYIKGYLPGIRENGGQYTHAASWVVIAAAILGEGDRAYRLFDYLNPVSHTASPEGVHRYKGEPYVTCGDVYSQSPHAGRAGWSWYSGSGGWLYQAGLEHILGLKIKGESFSVSPCIPGEWDGFLIVLRRNGVRYNINVSNPEGVQHGVVGIECSQGIVEDGWIRFLDNEAGDVSEEIDIKVTMGSPPAEISNKAPDVRSNV